MTEIVLILLICGIVAGIVGSLVGLGGGVIIALLFFLASGPGAIVGALVNTRMSGGSFLIGFGTFMIAVSFLLMMRGRWKMEEARCGMVRDKNVPL